MTADEFEARAAERGSQTVAELRASGQVVVPCDCDYIGCEGWRLTSKYALALDMGVSDPKAADHLAEAVYTSQDFDRTMRQISSAAGA